MFEPTTCSRKKLTSLGPTKSSKATPQTFEELYYGEWWVPTHRIHGTIVGRLYIYRSMKTTHKSTSHGSVNKPFFPWILWAARNSRKRLSSLKTNSSHLKMDGWNTSFLVGWPIFRCYVSFREGNFLGGFHWICWTSLPVFRQWFCHQNESLWFKPWQSSYMGVFLKCWQVPNKAMGFPTKNDQHLGWRLGVPPFKETPISQK